MQAFPVSNGESPVRVPSMITPSSSAGPHAISACPIVPSSAVMTFFSVKPNAVTRKSMAALGSS
jgi:hypothetical protein